MATGREEWTLEVPPPGGPAPLSWPPPGTGNEFITRVQAKNGAASKREQRQRRVSFLPNLGLGKKEQETTDRQSTPSLHADRKPCHRLFLCSGGSSAGEAGVVPRATACMKPPAASGRRVCERSEQPLFLFMILFQGSQAVDRARTLSRGSSISAESSSAITRATPRSWNRLIVAQAVFNVIMGIPAGTGTNEHPGPSFPCSFRVVPKLIYSLCHGHTQNEPSIRPEPLRICRMPFCLSHAAMSDCSRSMA